tara:strand:- start:408 stop:1076 length:669 start_codon:yes stop_codon:yes gene_type:complete
MKIEAVTVCIDFADKLQNVISNKNKLHRWLIVTHESDFDTISLCKKYNIEYICSKRVFDNASFAKGRAINDGLAHLNKTDWLLHLDADQKLPDNFNTVIETECKNKNLLYGCYRTDEQHNSLDRGQHTARITKTTGRKLKIQKKKCILPIGYFQLWHSVVCKTYEEQSTMGDKDDIIFMNKWITSDKNQTHIMNMSTIDVSGTQGHYLGHYIGIRNVSKNNA